MNADEHDHLGATGAHLTTMEEALLAPDESSNDEDSANDRKASIIYTSVAILILVLTYPTIYLFFASIAALSTALGGIFVHVITTLITHLLQPKTQPNEDPSWVSRLWSLLPSSKILGTYARIGGIGSLVESISIDLLRFIVTLIVTLHLRYFSGLGLSYKGASKRAKAAIPSANTWKLWQQKAWDWIMTILLAPVAVYTVHSWRRDLTSVVESMKGLDGVMLWQAILATMIGKVLRDAVPVALMGRYVFRWGVIGLCKCIWRRKMKSADAAQQQPAKQQGQGYRDVEESQMDVPSAPHSQPDVV
ncbi:hypothetical protein BXZ70DRAFT_281341 [Cristinia sonorae]|uniref:Uncharacterized protein n=1 Tax=Cristinia sonorae TaxID=1940300 RepID=A0A8K0UYZ9_9AGAR|nr:hypothetical protein BXZ70DRAFT_281341 [Cristinia sonorae]